MLQTSPRLNLTTDLGFMRLPRFRFLRSSLMLLAAACDHTSPFRPEPPAPAPPFSSFFPRRLTFNVGDDRTLAWLPDRSGIIYSSELFGIGYRGRFAPYQHQRRQEQQQHRPRH